MPGAPFVLPPLVLIATLVVSAVAKIRDPRDTSSVFVQLRLPRLLLRLRVPRLLPYGELLLAGLLLVAPGRWYVVASTATLLLFTAYFLVILRALRLPYPVSCRCFGRLGLGEVTGLTLARNGVLLVLALVTWADSWRGAGVADRLDELGAWAWGLAGLAAVVLAVALVLAVRARGREAPTADDLDPAAYQSSPAPDGTLHGPDGPVAVRALTGAAARFLVFCDPDQEAGLVRTTSSWAGRLAPVLVHVVTERQPQNPDPPLDLLLLDPRGAYRDRLEVTSPGAVLLGTDGMLAGGPVSGADEITALMEAVAAELGVTGPPT